MPRKNRPGKKKRALPRPAKAGAEYIKTTAKNAAGLKVLNGLVLSCGKNSFCVKENETGAVFSCSIKGKIMRYKTGKTGKEAVDFCEKLFYNPLCPGDRVRFYKDSEITGRIFELEDRKNAFSRYNEKGGTRQTLASNIDQAVIVASFAHPPWRPRFIDRVLVQCENSRIPAIIAVNKADLAHEGVLSQEELAEIENRLCVFASLGYKVVRLCALSGEGLEELLELLKNKTSVFTGQSGAGKSTIVNALIGDSAQKTGALVKKYDRGAHTTVKSVLLEGGKEDGRFSVIDAPGLRQFIPDVHYKNLTFCVKEFAALKVCEFGVSCTHTNEKGCSVREAVLRGEITKERWESFLALREDLKTRSFLRAGAASG
ncbi:MAG: ribosome small subunit-dependent GTPase A [Spirochaetaceae bacterium]|jgi:ribosome biogenesis GTPase|nr:ribosome small subunit-dependent GTPase A [Spirochaetaceae bacterium]